MQTHVRVLAILHIVFGALGLLAAVGILAVFGGIAGIVDHFAGPDAEVAAPILTLIGGVIFAVVAVLSLPGLIAGFGMMQYREWARIMGIVLSALDLLNVPFGTALGIYGLWVLLHGQTVLLFRNPPVPRW